MKYILIILMLAVAPAQAQQMSIQEQIAFKQAELSALRKQSAMQQAPMMYIAMTEMVKASSQCVAEGVATKKRFTRVATISKACREQAQLGAFAICATTVAQTGDTRDLNQCTDMMKDNGQWAQVWMRGLGVAGVIYGGQLATDVVLKGAVPLGIAAINKQPTAPVIVDPVVVDPVVVDPVIVESIASPEDGF